MGIWWVEARDAAVHPARHKVDPGTKNDTAPNGNKSQGWETCSPNPISAVLPPR